MTKQSRTEEFHDETLAMLEHLITSLLEAKEAFVAHRYEEAAGYLDEASSERKRVATRIDEMWEG